MNQTNQWMGRSIRAVFPKQSNWNFFFDLCFFSTFFGIFCALLYRFPLIHLRHDQFNYIIDHTHTQSTVALETHRPHLNDSALETKRDQQCKFSSFFSKCHGLACDSMDNRLSAVWFEYQLHRSSSMWCRSHHQLSSFVKRSHLARCETSKWNIAANRMKSETSMMTVSSVNVSFNWIHILFLFFRCCFVFVQ